MKKTRTRTAKSVGFLLTAAAAASITASASAQDCGHCNAEKSLTCPHQLDQKAAQAADYITHSKKPVCSFSQRAQSSAFSLSQYQIIERQANTFTSNHQDGTVLDVDSKGNLLVAWGSRRQEQGTYGVFAQRFDALGRPLGTEIRVNQFAPNTQIHPAVAFGPDDHAWVSWMSYNQDGYTQEDSKVVHAGAGEIYARRFGADSEGAFNPLSDEFRVNQTIRGHQELASVAVNKDGSALFTWTSNTDGKKMVMGRLFHADGTPATDEMKLSNCCTVSFQDKLASSTALPDGRFATVWARADADGNPVGLYGRLISADGTTTGEEILISEKAGIIDIEPAIDADASGRFVVAWMHQRDDTKYDVHARRFASNGEAIGDVIIVSDDDVQWKDGASLAVAPDGRFAVSWNEYLPLEESAVLKMKPQEPARVLAKVYSSEGKLLTDEAFQVNQFNKGQQRLVSTDNARRMAWTALDQLAFAWNGRTKSDGHAAAFTLLAPKDLEVPAPPVVTAVAAAGDMTPEDVVDPRALIPPVYDPNSISHEDTVQAMPAGPDFGFTGFTDTGWTPPDVDIAAGPNHIVVLVNGGIKFYTKSGTQTFTDTINHFWQPVGSKNFVFDPIEVYDHWSNRFIVAAAEHDGNIDYLTIAVSDDSDPNGTWFKYRINVNSLGDFVDFPNLGIGPDAVYIAADYFGSPTGNHIHILDKSKLLVGDPVVLKDVKTTTTQISLGSTNDYDDDGVQYFMTSYSGSSTKILIQSIQNPLGSPVRKTVNVTVPAFSQPPSPTQKGTSTRLASVDWRIKNGVVRNGHLWASHSVGVGGTAHVRWYDFDLQGWPTSGKNPIVNQSGDLDFGSGQHNWMVDIGVDTVGNAVLSYSRSSSNDFAYVSRSVRFVGDPAGTFQAPVTMVDGLGTDTSGRWGDYAGVDEDPSAPGTFWSSNEYPGSGNSNWRTWVGQIIVNAGMQIAVDQVVVGQTTNIAVSGADPNSQVYFFYSLKGEGATVISQLNVTLDIKKAKLIDSRTADANGNASLSKVVPNGAPVGFPIWFQTAGMNMKSSNFPRFIIQ